MTIPGPLPDTEEIVCNAPVVRVWVGWSPDGLTLAFSSDRSGNGDIWTVDIEEVGTQRSTYSEIKTRF